ncbi:gluconate 2-dehydrogenase subunit 3 family protein [Labrys monachus]|uniref:Gluconate 2-dehydrogenase gamma chain n=1 Tax=Labrys monachus TaxID=217067 RepID=A0ABU0FFF2_9HYPH|nr:gluconate 2-dehydrogenase subunit 3 family protein [Labrys monachus]MDQ0393328.1 gluconate 2-dehydrogenase gamma chain [Labrys monachus]
MPDTFFDAHQRATVEAAMARIIPTDDTPGAREAGCIDFLERYLSGLGYIFAKPDGSGFETLEGRSAEAWMRRVTIMRQTYRSGIEELDARARAMDGVDFIALPPERQDAVLRAIETSGGDDAPSAPADQPALQQTSTEVELPFLPLLVTHTRQGFYADPIYGGNRNQAGWKTIGFPGPASLAEVHAGRYTTLPYFADGEAEKVKEFHDGL